jgi:hypothetical protein
MPFIMSGSAQLEQQLNDFSPRARADALGRLVAGHADLLPAEGSNINMHFHSFFSYNAKGFSPSRIAWEARKAGLYAAGLCDFDVLDGLEEFFGAGRQLGLRTSVSLETRVTMDAYSDVDISSPGEPGVTYIMGAGFARVPDEGTEQAGGLAGYRQRARARNEALVARINPRVPEIAIDYETDVLPLSPSGAATERHIVRAYINKARTMPGGAGSAASYLAEILDMPLEEVVTLLADEPALEETVRATFVKRGGLGYEQPSPDTFPPADEFIRWVLSCGAVPMITWLDGTSGGEADGRALLECMQAMGCAALNIIPDRNWNIGEPGARDLKREHLAEIVALADTMHLPINIGTEMNKLGLPFTDDLAGEVLRDYQDPFLRGARIMVGHCLLLRYASFSYVDEAATVEFADVEARNAFFERVGGMPPMTEDLAKRLEDMGPEKALGWFRDAAKA